MEITIGQNLFLENVPDRLFGEIQGRLTVQNPRSVEAERMEKRTGNLDWIIILLSTCQPDCQL